MKNHLPFLLSSHHPCCVVSTSSMPLTGFKALKKMLIAEPTARREGLLFFCGQNPTSILSEWLRGHVIKSFPPLSFFSITIKLKDSVQSESILHPLFDFPSEWNVAFRLCCGYCLQEWMSFNVLRCFCKTANTLQANWETFFSKIVSVMKLKTTHLHTFLVTALYDVKKRHLNIQLFWNMQSWRGVVQHRKHYHTE